MAQDKKAFTSVVEGTLREGPTSEITYVARAVAYSADEVSTWGSIPN